METDNMISKDMLLEVAKKKGLTNRDHVEKDYFQDLLLFHIYKKTNHMVFKGGTALYKIYNMPRFSEDLDFSLLKDADVDNMVHNIVNSSGGKVKSVKKIKSSILFKIRFEGILTVYNTIRIDVNTRNTVFGYDVKNYIPDYMDINPFSLRVLKTEEILAEKIHALLSREKARDLHDLFFLLRFVEPDKILIEKKLEIFDKTFEFREFKDKLSNIEPVWEKELRPFVLSDLPEFEIVRKFVLDKMSPISK